MYFGHIKITRPKTKGHDIFTAWVRKDFEGLNDFRALPLWPTMCSLSLTASGHLPDRPIFEGANSPTTFRAETALEKRSIIVVPDMLANGGGVNCSYFEWLKNLDHIAPGRKTKKYSEKQNIKIMETMGYKIPKTSPHMKQLAGAREIEIVCSGLEEIMKEATKEIPDEIKEFNDNQKTDDFELNEVMYVP